MKKGKLDNETLARLVLGKTGAARPEVLVGAGIGEDCAVIGFGGADCVVSTDPITATSRGIGAHAIHVACNDVAAAGAEPVAVLLTVLLPETITEEEIAQIAADADRASREIGVQIAGGHTEVTDAVNQPLISATALGKSPGEAAGPPAPGCRIFVTKALALEGTAILADKCAAQLKSVLTDGELAAARGLLSQLSVVKEGVLAGRAGASDMHDITEGGVLGAVWEICTLHGVGARIRMMDLPFEDVTLTACAVLGLDPMRLISSGSMLIVCPDAAAATLTAAIEGAGIRISEIGEITAAQEGIIIVNRKNEPEAIAPPGPDEIYKV
ncbi:MAG: AIR synthase family protein [Clostridiales Family XIII bacterium]|jgi:hydrogenase expression/formation protein HypE|nr:AIR synthase family protein [Clostridiales Family XIII bacterium]